MDKESVNIQMKPCSVYFIKYILLLFKNETG